MLLKNSNQRITIPVSVISFMLHCFVKCTRFAQVSFKNNSRLQAICFHAFYDCSSLTNW